MDKSCFQRYSVSRNDSELTGLYWTIICSLCREDTAPPSNSMGIRADSKRRKKLMQKRLAMGHKQDDHEQEQEQGYSLDIR